MATQTAEQADGKPNMWVRKKKVSFTVITNVSNAIIAIKSDDPT